MHPIYSIPLFITSIFVVSFGLLVFFKNPTNKLNRLFCLSSLSVSLWSFGYGLLYYTDNAEHALFYARLGYIGVVFMPTLFCHFVMEFLRSENKPFLYISYSLSTIFLIVSRYKIFLDGCYLYFWGYYPKAGPLYSIFIVFFYGCFSTCIFYLFKFYQDLRKTNKNILMQNQVKYVFLAFFVASMSISDYLPNYHIEIYPFAYLCAAGWLAIMAYVTFKYRLMDINLIIRKTLIYSAVTGTLTIVYLSTIALFAHLFEGFTGYQTVFSSAIAACLITLGFQPLRKRVQTFVDGKFFRQYVDREEKLYELSREVITHTTPEAMAEALLKVLGDSLHPKYAALYLRSREGNNFNRILQTEKSTFPDLMNEDNALPKYFVDHPQPFVQDLPSGLSDIHDTRDPSRREDAA